MRLERERAVRLAPELPDAANPGRLVFDFAEPPESSWTADPPRATGGTWKRYAGDLYLTLSGAVVVSRWAFAS